MIRLIQDEWIKNPLTQWGTEEKNRKINEYTIGEKPALVDIVKNILTQIGDGEKKPNNKFNEKSPNSNKKWERKTKPLWKRIEMIWRNIKLYTLL